MANAFHNRQPAHEYSLTLTDVSRHCGVETERILVLVSEGILSPRGSAQPEWRFAADDLGRAQSAVRLQRDLDINLAGAALALDLIEEMRHLRERVRMLEALLFQRQER